MSGVNLEVSLLAVHLTCSSANYFEEASLWVSEVQDVSWLDAELYWLDHQLFLLLSVDLQTSASWSKDPCD